MRDPRLQPRTQVLEAEVTAIHGRAGGDHRRYTSDEWRTIGRRDAVLDVAIDPFATDATGEPIAQPFPACPQPYQEGYVAERDDLLRQFSTVAPRPPGCKCWRGAPHGFDCPSRATPA